MIKQFESIKNLGVFSNYVNPADFPIFKRFNLIYGTNGSGKTTLSRFFNDLNTGVAPGFPELKYKINADEGKFTHGQPYTRSIRVFNSEYVDNNIGEIEGQLNPIFIIGEDNKTLAAQLENDEKVYADLIEKISLECQLNAKFIKQRSKQFTDIARTISQNTAGTSSRKYNKKHAETAFANMEDGAVLTPLDLVNAIAALKQSARDPIFPINVPHVALSQSSDPVKLFVAIAMLTGETKKIVKESATSIAIKDLTNNPGLASWVESGREIHISEKTCQYCLQVVPAFREEALQKHFNDSDKNLKAKILGVMSDARIVHEAFKNFKLPRRDSFYKEKQESFTNLKEIFDIEMETISSFVSTIDDALTDKLSRRTESYEIDMVCPDAQTISDTIIKLVIITEATNAETAAFEARIEKQQSSIETHHLSTVSNVINGLDEQIKASADLLCTYKNGLETNDDIGSLALKDRIDAARITLSNSLKGADNLSQKLASFLGREDLKFVAEDQGYRIERFGRPAQKLSEGEKTAIAFLHFVVGLNDKDFNLSEGIVVIDDPISSLDAASVYQAFGFLKTAVKNAKQIFLMTHNFDFLKLLLNWLKYYGENSAYIMLQCTQDATSRETTICELDKVLQTASSEYQYLFKTLREFQSDGTIANCYHIPNVVRKVLETFLDQHSNGSSLYKKLDNLDYDEQKKTALNKYANDLSHSTFSGIDPSLIGETQRNVGIVLKMMEDVAPMHFEALVKKTL